MWCGGTHGVATILSLFVCLLLLIRSGSANVLQNPHMSNRVSVTSPTLESHSEVAFVHQNGASVLQELISVDKSVVTSISLSHCTASAAEFSRMVKVLATFPHLTHVEIANFPLDESSLRALVPLLRKIATTLRSLSFAGAGLDDSSATTLRFILRVLPQLESLDLSRNSITGEGLAALSDGFRKSGNHSQPTSLQVLDLSYNPLGPTGYHTLCQLLSVGRIPSLQALYLRETGGSATTMATLLETLATVPNRVEVLDLAGNPLESTKKTHLLAQMYNQDLNKLLTSTLKDAPQAWNQVWDSVASSVTSVSKSIVENKRSGSKEKIYAKKRHNAKAMKRSSLLRKTALGGMKSSKIGPVLAASASAGNAKRLSKVSKKATPRTTASIQKNHPESKTHSATSTARRSSNKNNMHKPIHISKKKPSASASALTVSPVQRFAHACRLWYCKAKPPQTIVHESTLRYLSLAKCDLTPAWAKHVIQTRDNSNNNRKNKKKKKKKNNNDSKTKSKPARSDEIGTQNKHMHIVLQDMHQESGQTSQPGNEENALCSHRPTDTSMGPLHWDLALNPKLSHDTLQAFSTSSPTSS